MIELVGIKKRYHIEGREIVAIDDVSLQIPAGGIFGIIGESGAGKSSLLRSINLLERPDEGVINVAGLDVTAMNEADLRQVRRQIGMIFQHFNLLSSGTVYNNVALPLKFCGLSKHDIDERIHPLIEMVGLTDKLYHYPHQLSGGQKQRVAIARALATQPHVLLCDEATSALDPKTTESILSLLRDINEKTGLTIVLITHELEVIKSVCDRVALMAHGRIVEMQDVIDFFAHPQSDIAKELVESSLKMKIPPDLRREIDTTHQEKKYPIVRIVFRGTLVREAVITIAARRFGIDISILQSNIEFIGKSAIGFLLAELRGDSASIKNSLSYFAEKELDYEVIGYVS